MRLAMATTAWRAASFAARPLAWRHPAVVLLTSHATGCPFLCRQDSGLRRRPGLLGDPCGPGSRATDRTSAGRVSALTGFDPYRGRTSTRPWRRRRTPFVSSATARSCVLALPRTLAAPKSDRLLVLSTRRTPGRVWRRLGEARCAGSRPHARMRRCRTCPRPSACRPTRHFGREGQRRPSGEPSSCIRFAAPRPVRRVASRRTPGARRGAPRYVP